MEDYELYEKFAAKYQGRIVEFDGIIAAMNQRGDYKTRYDILVFAGDGIESGVTGPNFQFNDVNVVNDLHLTGRTFQTLWASGRSSGSPPKWRATPVESQTSSCWIRFQPK